ncbi:MAG TPA: hypothetical protein VMH90_02225 [Thermoplasmata archaeon]|nr:hypothetical protein [Thermoplasmata archaeon]
MELFGGGARDRAQLVRTLETLGPTSVDRLSRALAWPPTRTTRALRSLARSGAAISFNAATGQVSPVASIASAPSVPEAPPSPPDPAGGSPAELPDAGALPVPGTCTVCHQPLSTTGTPGTFYCLHCGNLETRGTPRPAPAPPGAAAPSGVHREGGVDDRQAQELFAAWVTGTPIACPRCRQPLNHRGVESYACPACGERVTFANAGGVSVVDPPTP